MLRRILVTLAGTSYTSVAIKTAIDLAQRHSAEVTGVTVVDLARLENVGSVPLGAGQAAKELREHRVAVTRQRVEEAIDEFTTACAAAGVGCEVRREERSTPFDYLISQSRYHDLMILGLRSILEYGVVGEPHDDPSLLLARLITEGVRPILAVGPEFRPVKRVMIAYSGSVESAKTMKRFVEMQPWGMDIALRIVTFEHAHERAGRLLADAARYCRAHGLAPQTDYIAESAKDHLLPEAQAWNADLIVLGNSARSLLLRRVFGDTALHAIANAESPLFLSQ